LRYRLQSKHYDLLKRSRTTDESRKSQAEGTGVNADTDDEDPLGTRKGKGKRRKLFGLVEVNIYPKMTKSALARELKQLRELCDSADNSDLAKCLLDCAGVIQRTLTVESASSLMSTCPVFFSTVKYLQNHMRHLTGGNDIFVNAVEHLEFQMELVFQYLTAKLPKTESLKVLLLQL
jgi:hypothetical protein